MWCRLITGDESAEAKAITWRGESELSALPGGRPESLYSEAERGGYSSATQGQRIDQRVAEAFQAGLRDGEAAATQRLMEQVGAKVAQLAHTIEQVAMHRVKIHREAEPELVKLSLAIARRVLRRELTVDPDSLLGLVKAGLEKIESSEVHRVRVYPEHAATLRRLLEGSARPVAIVEDPGLPVGGIIFETTRGSLDIGLETQLKEIERGFADIYPR